MYIEYTFIIKQQRAPLFPCVKKKKIVCEKKKKGLSDYPTTNSCILDEQTEKILVIDRIFYKTSKFKMKFTKKNYDPILNKIFDLLL